MSQRPSSPDPLEALLQAHGLSQHSAAFAAALLQLVAARYARPQPELFRAGAWLGKAVLLALAGLLLLTGYAAVPVAVFTVLGPALAAGVLGTGGVIWLLEQSRKRILLPRAGG